MRLIFATQNRNKVTEVAALLPANFELLTMGEAGIRVDIPETGSTIAENSILKARHLQDILGPLIQGSVIAEDSGLEVEALNDAPGVYSARYAGESKNDVANNLKLLQEMAIHTNRKARFVTVLTLILHGKVHTFEGEVRGTIAYEPRGNAGFGYDPLFIPTGYRSTFAELGLEVKNKISHRSKAVNQLVDFFNQALS
jgi:XTP/dITP diphosphohydrolase